MRFALNKQGERIFPSKGAEGFCPLCGGAVHARCGKYNIWHFAHDNLEECDTWSEGEREWHRKWKEKVSEEFREVVVEKNGQKHRADIMISDGTVIELQHSHISFAEVREREEFYEDMIWVVDCTQITDNMFVRPYYEEITKKEYKFKERINSPEHNYYDLFLVHVCEICDSNKYSKDDWKGCSKCDRVMKIVGFYERKDEVLYWKNKHKVWFDAQKGVFLDLGEDKGIFSIESYEKGTSYCRGYLFSHEDFYNMYDFDVH